jgi:hypothetical protein
MVFQASEGSPHLPLQITLSLIAPSLSLQTHSPSLRAVSNAAPDGLGQKQASMPVTWCEAVLGPLNDETGRRYPLPSA